MLENTNKSDVDKEDALTDYDRHTDYEVRATNGKMSDVYGRFYELNWKFMASRDELNGKKSFFPPASHQDKPNVS